VSAAHDAPLPPAPAHLAPDETELWGKLAALAPHLTRATAPLFRILVATLADAARVRGAALTAESTERRHVLTRLLASKQGFAAMLLRDLRMPALHKPGVD
jgi:hypothetical protein